MVPVLVPLRRSEGLGLVLPHRSARVVLAEELRPHHRLGPVLVRLELVVLVLHRLEVAAAVPLHLLVVLVVLGPHRRLVLVRVRLQLQIQLHLEPVAPHRLAVAAPQHRRLVLVPGLLLLSEVVVLGSEALERGLRLPLEEEAVSLLHLRGAQISPAAAAPKRRLDAFVIYLCHLRSGTRRSHVKCSAMDFCGIFQFGVL